MKKFAVGLLGAALVLGAGTAVFAAGNNGEGEGGFGFEQMLPFMQKMHPDASKDQLQDMYKECHGNGGMMQGTSSMMNNF